MLDSFRQTRYTSPIIASVGLANRKEPGKAIPPHVEGSSFAENAAIAVHGKLNGSTRSMRMGVLKVERYLTSSKGTVTGTVVTDAKDRRYFCQYHVEKAAGDAVRVQCADGTGDAVVLPHSIELDSALVGFFGLYSGDGAKGTEDPDDSRRIRPQLSFSQTEPHLVRFAVGQFRRLFGLSARFTFSLGEDSAYFMAGEGRLQLEAHYQQQGLPGIPGAVSLAAVRPVLDAADERYLGEVRPDIAMDNEDSLAFYYQHKAAMEEILRGRKTAELESVCIEMHPSDSITASLRRPFKKGARSAGGSSRSDEVHVGGVRGIGELFLKMLHEIEESILCDTQVSHTGLVVWDAQPSATGPQMGIRDFFRENPFGQVNGQRPTFLSEHGDRIVGKWYRSAEVSLATMVRISPLWCYVAGLYLAEGSTPKSAFFQMYYDKPGPLSLGFTSSEGATLELVLRCLRQVFLSDAALHTWKVKVGAQYFSELVVIGLKATVPMLRGGNSGDGKLRTMEISLALKDWAQATADLTIPGGSSLLRTEYSHRYSHVEPTGAGVARIDFAASSSLCKWYFPLVIYALFSGQVADPVQEFRR